MKKTFIVSVASVLALVCSAGAGEGVKLVGEKEIMKLTKSGPARMVGKVGAMRLSPDGKHLLYIRREKIKSVGEGGKERTRTGYRLVLRALAAGTDKVLPAPAFDDDTAIFVVMYVGMNPFGAGGRKIALPVGIDANRDGLTDSRGGEKMNLGIYDVATGKLAMAVFVEVYVFPSFDGTGKRVVVLALERKDKDGRLLVMSVEKGGIKRLKMWGLPRSLCPTADLVPLLVLEGGAGARKEKFLLYDFQADKVTAALRMHERNTQLDDYNPQWTADGRYLYYFDVEVTAEDGQDRKQLSRIWDVKAGKEVGLLDGLIAIGPGPGRTTMLMGSAEGDRGLVVHDAAGDTITPIQAGQIEPISAQGKHLIYTRRAEGGGEAVYVAELVMPRMQPATLPSPSSGPAAGGGSAPSAGER